MAMLCDDLVRYRMLLLDLKRQVNAIFKHLDYGGQELTTHLYNTVSGGRWHHNSAQCLQDEAGFAYLTLKKGLLLIKQTLMSLLRDSVVG